MFEIVIYQAVEPIRFGMPADELMSTVGDPSLVRKNRSGELNYLYPDFNVRLSVDSQKVVEVGLSSTADVRMAGIEIFKSATAFDELVRLDGNPLEKLGFILLLNLGITLTGFHDNDTSQKAVTAFAKGRWETSVLSFRKYSGK